VSDTRTWRVGSHYGIHLYAVNPAGDDEPIGTALTPEIAAQIVAEHALVTTPYADDDHRGGSWADLFMRQEAEIARLRRELRQPHPGGKTPRVWRRSTVCSEDVAVVHDSDGTVWRRQPNRLWLADTKGATPGAWEDLVRVFGPITEGLPPDRMA
jgi:hypothetical protein